MFEFHAGYVHVDDTASSISFADGRDPKRNIKHYFIMQRSEEFPEEAVKGMKNVYIERDDQCWGGYGGISSVLLNRDSLTLKLSPRMTTQMGGHDTIRVTFVIKDAEFRELRQVLASIMLGYEPRLTVTGDLLNKERSVEFSVFETPTAN